MVHRAMQNLNIIMFKIRERQKYHSALTIALFYVSTIIGMYAIIGVMMILMLDIVISI
jgi:hypothetical protein